MKTDTNLVARYLASNYSELQKIIGLADTKANIIGLSYLYSSIFLFLKVFQCGKYQ